MSQRWIIASNRLPFQVNPETGKVESSSGGLVTAISGIQSDNEITWVGYSPEELDLDSSDDIDRDKQYKQVSLSEEVYDLYYNGMCNDVLWPLLHYESNFVQYSEDRWKAYVDVNKEFARAILEVAEDDDLVWVHDFHLFLLPRFLKRQNKKLRVGFFLHIPFPSSEIFRQLPVRKEILDSVLCSDLVGFHDYSYLRHFCSSIYTILGIESGMMEVQTPDYTTRLGVFPVSIDVSNFKREAMSTEVKRRQKKFRRNQSYQKLVLGIDRLDYIKGIELKLRAFGEMLTLYPELRDQVGLLQLAVPSRTDVPEYKRLKEEIEQLVGEINGKFGSPTYTPVQYMFSSVSFHDLLALYRLADVMLVTSKRDGMNLVALEYICAQRTANPGVVVLSEFAGAISTLSHVIRTNPWDIQSTAHNTYVALTMDREERVTRQRSMIKYLDSYQATDWARTFMENLTRASTASVSGKTTALSVRDRREESLQSVLERVNSKHKVLFVDYDGTLVRIVDEPGKAILSPQHKEQLRDIVERENVELVVTSGRDSKFLERQLGDLRISLCAEHGAQFYDRHKGRWSRLIRTDRQTWYDIAKKVMSDYTARVPDSFVERKNFAIAWHYRKSPGDFGNYQARKLKFELENQLANLPVTVLAGKKVVEVRAMEANKGVFARWYLDNIVNGHSEQSVIAIGDDETDEDMFRVVNPHGVTIKVGGGQTVAQHRLERQGDVLALIDLMSE